MRPLVGAAKKARAAFKFEQARGVEARREAANIFSLKPEIMEAIGVLARESETLVGAGLNRAKGLASERPAMFDHGMPLHWIRTQSAQDLLIVMTEAFFAGEQHPLADEDKAFFESFAGDVDPDLPRFTLDDVVEEALAFIQASLKRHLTPADRIALSLSLPRIEGGKRASAPSKITVEACDAALEAELFDILHALDYDQQARWETARSVSREILSGDLSPATPASKAHFLAWTARLGVGRTGQQEVDELVDHAKGFAQTDYVRVAVAMCSVAPIDDALEVLQPMDTSVLRGGAVRLRARSMAPKEFLQWVEDTGWDDAELDLDGRAILLNKRMAGEAWQAIRRAIDDFTDEDFRKQPNFLHLAATGLTATSLAPDFRHLVLEGVPFGAAEIWLSADSHAVEDRRRAAELFRRASVDAYERRGPALARQWKESELWLKLRDPISAAAARNQLSERIGKADEALSLVPLAVDFGLALDFKAVDQSIQQARTRQPKGSLEIARAQLARISTIDDGAMRAQALGDAEEELAKFLNREALVGMRAATIAEYDKEGALALAEDAKSGGLTSAVLDRFIADLKVELGVAEPERISDLEAASTPALSNEFLRVLRTGPAERLVEIGRTLLQRTRSDAVAERLVMRLEDLGLFADVDAILADEAKDLVENAPALRATRAWSAFRRGLIAEADADLRHLETLRADANDRALRYNLCLVSGKWDDLNGLIEKCWSDAPDRSAAELLDNARLASALKHPRRAMLTDRAAEKGKERPEILIGCYFVAVQDGRDDDPVAASWLAAAASLSGPDGPVRQGSIEEIVEQIPERRRQLRDSQLAYQRGELPLFLLSKVQNRNLLDAQLLTMVANQRETDPSARTLINLFAGTQRRGETGLSPRSIAFDAASLMTLAVVDRLEPTFAFFDDIVFPHSLLAWLFGETVSLGYHQPSQVSQARKLRNSIAEGRIAVADDRAASPGRVDKVGILLAGLVELAEREREAGNQAFVVNPFPLTAPGSLGRTPLSGDAVDGLFVSNHALIAGAHSELDEQEKARAEALMSLYEEAWPTEVVPTSDTILLLDELALAHLRAAGIVEPIMRAYPNIRVSKRVITDGDALIAREDLASEIQSLVHKIRGATAAALASGKGRLASAVLDQSAAEHPNAESFLASDVEVIVSDERYYNRYHHMDRPSGLVPIWTTIDVLTAIGMSDDDIWRAFGILRKAGAAFVPVTQREISDMLSKAAVDANGDLVETARLKALRENFRLCQYEAVVRLPAEAPWASGVDHAMIGAIREQWDASESEEVAAAKSNWLLRIMDIRDWAQTFEGPTVEAVARNGLGGILSRLLMSYGDGEKKEFGHWLAGHVEDLAIDSPREYHALVEGIRSSVREAAQDRLGGRLDSSLTVGEIAEINLGLLPPFMQLKVAADLSFHDDFDLTISGELKIGSGIAAFDREAFHRSAADCLTDGEPRILRDLEGRDWTFSQPEADKSTLRIERGDGEFRLKDFFAIDPDRERRIRGFEHAASQSGMDPAARKEWSRRLDEAALIGDRTTYLEDDLAAGAPFARALLRSRRKDASIDIRSLVPRDRRFYERLVGVGVRLSLREYADEVVIPHQRRLITDRSDGALEASLASSHPFFAAGISDDLTDSDLAVLASSLSEQRDLMGMVLVIEAVLGRGRRSADLEATLIAISERLLEHLKANEGVRALSAMFILTDGELSVLSILHDVPPMVRRAMSFANAALVGRTLGDQLYFPEFYDWVIENQSYQFVLQSLVDLRSEPRWGPDLAEPEQLRQELIGRLLNASVTAAPELDGRLKEVLVGKKKSLLSLGTFTHAFPGPLEGGVMALPLAAPVVVEAIDKALAELSGTISSLVPVVNAWRMGDFGEARVQALVELLKTSNYLIEGLDADRGMQSIFQAFAGIAAAARSGDLADAARISARRHRSVDPSAEDLIHEFRVAVVAAAAFPDIERWLQFIGESASELAEVALKGRPAAVLLSELTSLCAIEPMLRATMGRAIARLRLIQGE